jgi:hypothetical protein
MAPPPPLCTAAGAPVPAYAFSRAAAVAAAAAPPARAAAEYVYLTPDSARPRSITRVVDAGVPLRDLPLASVDASATGGGPPAAAALFLKPRAAFAEPLRGGRIVLCDAYGPPTAGRGAALVPAAANARVRLEAVADDASDDEPLVGLTQQWLAVENGVPIGARMGGRRPGRGRGRRLGGRRRPRPPQSAWPGQ